MYRLVVVLMIVSLSGSEASGESEPEWDAFGGNNQNRNSGLFRILESTPLYQAEDLLQTKRAGMKPEEFNEFEVARDLVEKLDRRSPEGVDKTFLTDRDRQLTKLILSKFADLKSMDDGIKRSDIICDTFQILKLNDLEHHFDLGLLARSNEINMDLDLDWFLVRKVSEMAKKYYTHCMPKLKQKFYSKLDKPELKDAFDRMGVFESFIDEEKAAQRHGAPRYCNDEIQKFKFENYNKLASKIETEFGKNPLIIQGNTNHSEEEDRREMMRKLFDNTCGHEEFFDVRPAVDFIMSAKRSYMFNIEWNSMFDCGENMGRFQLCDEIWRRFERSDKLG